MLLNRGGGGRLGARPCRLLLIGNDGNVGAGRLRCRHTARGPWGHCGDGAARFPTSVTLKEVRFLLILKKKKFAGAKTILKRNMLLKDNRFYLKKFGSLLYQIITSTYFNNNLSIFNQTLN